MVNSRLEAQRQTILHYWLSGTQSPKEIHQKTNIPLRTIKYDLKKLRDTKPLNTGKEMDVLLMLHEAYIAQLDSMCTETLLF